MRRGQPAAGSAALTQHVAPLGTQRSAVQWVPRTTTAPIGGHQSDRRTARRRGDGRHVAGTLARWA